MLLHLQNHVRDFRTRHAPSLLDDLKQEREQADLSATDWEAFRLDYTGQVDTLLTERIKQANLSVSALRGPAKTDPAPQANPDPTVALIPVDVNLADQSLSLLERELARLRTLVGVVAHNAKRFTSRSDKITKAGRADQVLQQIERIRALIEARRSAYAAIFEAIVEEERELADLYAPIKARISEAAGSLSKLSFSVRRNVGLSQWAANGEELLDLQTNGPFEGRGECLRSARAGLMAARAAGDAARAATTLLYFVKTNEVALRTHMPENVDFRAWARDVSDWLYSTDHITVGYGLQYDGVDTEQL